MKKTLIIIVIVLVALFVGGYFYFSKTPVAEQPEALKPIGVVYKEFFPLGGEPALPNNEVPVENNETPSEETPTDTPTVHEKITKLSDFPTAGYGFGVKDKKIIDVASDEIAGIKEKSHIEKVPVVRYVEKGTGHVYERELPDGVQTKISNTTIPGIQEAFVLGNTVVFRFLDDSNVIRTFSGLLPKPEADGSLPEMKGAFLPDNIGSLSVNPINTKIFTLKSNENAEGVISDPDGTKRVKVFDSAFHSWLSSWISTENIILTTKASAHADGYVYSLNTTTKTLSRILGNIPGLTTLVSPNGKYMLYSSGINNGIETNIYDIASQSKISLSTTTIPEKCVWSKTNNWFICGTPDGIAPGLYPDIWYQGKISFVDSIWKIDRANGVANKVSSPFDEKNLSLDSINLSLDSKEENLYLLDKNEENLWQISLSL